MCLGLDGLSGGTPVRYDIVITPYRTSSRSSALAALERLEDFAYEGPCCQEAIASAVREVEVFFGGR